MSGGNEKDEETAGGTTVPQVEPADIHENPRNTSVHNHAERDEQSPSELSVVADNVYSFDRRPGVFDATRGIAPGMVVYGHRADIAGWRVQVAQRGALLLDLDPETARTIGRELIAYAELCDEGNAA